MILFWIVISFVPATVGYWFRPGTWYRGLRKPAWNPPNWIFGPVWTLLYLLMGIAAWLAWRHAGWSTAIWLYLAQLALNALWTPLFFGLRSTALSLADITLLWVAIAVTTAAFWQIDPLAGGLMLPYLAWVSFAAALNLTIWRLNSGRPQPA